MFQPYLLELEGKPAGRFFESRGGNAEAAVVESAGPGPVRKHLGAVRYTDVALACGPGMSRVFYDWLASTFSGSFRRMNGAVVALDHSSKPVSRLEVQDALLTSLVLPDLSKSNPKQAVLVVSLKPARTSTSNSTGQQGLGPYASGVGKTWRASDFRLRIDGLEAACLQVTGIQALTLGEQYVEDAVGSARITTREPSKTTFSDLVVQIPKPHADGFYKWQEDFVVKGNNSSDREKNGSLDYLPPGSANPYFTIKLKGLGIYKITQDTSSSVTATMYCDDMVFSAGPNAIH